MPDDDQGRLAGHLAGAARRHAAQQARPGRPSVKRVGRFHGEFSHAYWLTAAWSPDGSQLAFGGKNGANEGVLEIWNQSGHHEGFSVRRLTRDLAGEVLSLTWSPDGKHLATIERDPFYRARTLHVRGQAGENQAVDLPPRLFAEQVAWSPDGSLLAVSGPACERTVLFDPATGGERHVLEGLSGPVTWKPDGRMIAGVHGTGVLLFDPVTGQRVGTLAEQDHVPTAVAWARDGRHLAVANGERITVCDAGTPQWDLPWTTLDGDRGNDPAIASLAWLDGGRYLLEFRPRGGTWRDENDPVVSTVILWDGPDWQFVELLYAGGDHSRGPISGVAPHPDGRRLALALDEHAPVIWRITGDLPNAVT